MTVVTINYTGFNPTEIEFVNSQEFRTALEANPNLGLIASNEDDDGNEIFLEVHLPLPENSQAYLALTNYGGTEFMWVLNNDDVKVKNPIPSFVEVLKVMDAYTIKTLNKRLFNSKNGELRTDSSEALSATFDYATGDYNI